MSRYYFFISVFTLVLGFIMFDFQKTYWSDNKIIDNLMNSLSCEESIISEKLHTKIEVGGWLDKYEIIRHYNYYEPLTPDQFIRYALFNIVDEFNSYRTYDRLNNHQYPVLYVHIADRHVNHTIEVYLGFEDDRIIIDDVQGLLPFLVSANQQFLFIKNKSTNNCPLSLK